MPGTVDAGYVDWLKKGALFVTASPAIAASWPNKGVETEITVPFNNRAAAVAEGDRQALFLGGPNVKDKLLVPGARKDLIGKAFTAKGDRLGYTAGGIVVFVLAADEQDDGTTVLTVLRRL